MLPPPVSSTASCEPEAIFMLPPPLSASILPWAELTLIEPPPVCRLTSEATLPTSMLPPPVSALTLPPISSTRMVPPPLCASTRPVTLLAVTLPPSVSILISSIWRDVDSKVARKFVRAAALPFGYDPRRISVNVGVDLVGLEFTPGFVFRTAVRVIMNDVGDVLLRAALHVHRTNIHLDFQILDRGKRSGDLLRPVAALAIDTGLLRACQRQDEQQDSRDFRYLLQWLPFFCSSRPQRQST